MSIADKQCRSQFLFELVNLPRKGRLRQMQYRSGFCHVLLTGNGKKIAQDPEFHEHITSINRIRPQPNNNGVLFPFEYSHCSIKMNLSPLGNEERR